MTSTSLLSAARAALLAGIALAVGGCCEIGVICVEVVAAEDAGSGADREAPPLATSGCDPNDISNQNGGVCADCSSETSGDVRICGEEQRAECINQENAYGERCQRCVTASGEILFDDCAIAPDDVGASRCELTPGDPSQGASEDESQCSVCFDDAGNVVSQTCEPVSDECHQVTSAGRDCRECTRGGEVVLFQCENVNIDPSFCEAYGNESGTCVDCYADSGSLLSHECFLVDDQPIFTCVETVDPSGLSCVQCFDQFGNREDLGCTAGIPEARACQLLSYSTQTCVVCVDDFGEPVFTDCTPAECTEQDPALCRTQSQCFFEGNEQGQLCRTCFFDDNTGEAETACLTNTDLVCSGVSSGDLPPDPNNPDGEPAPPPDAPEQDCLVCSDVQTGVEVYRNCGNASAPPVCVDELDADGQLCTFCYDGASGAPLYSTCGDTCYVTGERVLTDEDGNALTSNDANTEAIATCYQCSANGMEDITAADFGAICSLPQECAGPDGFVDPNDGCPDLINLLLAPRQCENGWDVYQAAPGSEEELLAVLSWSLSVHSLSLAGVAALASGTDATCNDGAACGTCARGDLLEITFETLDFELVRGAFSSQLIACQDDAVCPAGSMCFEGFCGR